MSKGLEYVKSELELSYDCLTTYDRIMLNGVLQDLERLEAIDNANPSEALECLNKIVESFNETTTGMYELGEVVVANDLVYSFKKELDTIKQALLKAQEQERVLKIIYEKNVIDIKWLKGSRNYKEYNSKILDIYNDLNSLLTQEEFDLLNKWYIK